MTKQLSKPVRKGPAAYDIFPIVGSTKKGLETAAQTIGEAVMSDGGVKVYRMPEITDEIIDEEGMKNGDIAVIGKSRVFNNTKLVEVAEITGSVQEVMDSFRFLTDSSFHNGKLAVPPTLTAENLSEKQLTDGRLLASSRNIESSTSTLPRKIEDLYTF